MGMYTNIGGSSKRLSSLYINNNGTRKKLSNAYGNINGTSKELLQVLYRWKKTYASKWESTYRTGSGTTYSYSDRSECSHCGYTHTFTGGRYDFYGYYYSSVSYNSSTGTFTGSGATWTSDINEDNYLSYKGKWYLYDNNHLALKMGDYTREITDCGISNGTGFTIPTYYYAVPTEYNGTTEILTGTGRYSYYDGEKYESAIGYDYYDASNNDGIKHYGGYRIDYLGQY